MKMSAGRPQCRALTTVLALMLMLLAGPALARITAEVDRRDVALGETLRLILRADNGEQPDELDLTELEQDFQILQRSSATSARIISGEQSVSRTLELEISPRRDGLLTIPAFAYDGRLTTPIAVKVEPQQVLVDSEDLVYFTAELSKNEVYVQAQAILTITLQQAINLDNRTVSELDIPNTYIETLEQKSFQRRAAGRLWQVTELRYALFPQQSGELTIPPIAFSARELLPGRSLLGARLGRRISIQSEAITLNVKPVPANFPGDTWLPAQALELKDRWSTSPQGLAVGDSATRTVELTAEGLQGSQLPPVTSLQEVSLEGLRFYPDQETVEGREIPTGVEGYRLQSEALVATAAGDWSLPELRVPWWNTDTDSLEYATLPATSVSVATTTTVPVSSGETGDRTTAAGMGAGSATLLQLWQGATLVGWCLALALGLAWWRASQEAPVASRSVSAPKKGDHRSLIALRLACSENNPAAARDAVLLWGQQWLGQATPISLDLLARRTTPALSKEIRALDRALYSPDAEQWQGEHLFQQVKEQGTRVEQGQQNALSLYPNPI